MVSIITAVAGPLTETGNNSRLREIRIFKNIKLTL